ncbi:MAG: Txe/YoeB family addiction module toxin [Verrucomicrobiota bacterium]
MSYELVYTTQAKKDAKKLKGSSLAKKARKLLDSIGENPFADPPFEALVGDLRGVYSRRLNIQHRLVYQVYEEERIVKIMSLGDAPHHPLQHDLGGGDAAVAADFTLGAGFGEGNRSLFFMDVESDVQFGRRV